VLFFAVVICVCVCVAVMQKREREIAKQTNTNIKDKTQTQTQTQTNKRALYHAVISCCDHGALLLCVRVRVSALKQQSASLFS
jgi:uncharacterized membrane protein